MSRRYSYNSNGRYFLSCKTSVDAQEERAKHGDKLQKGAMNSTRF
jgi:hypothetical protein